MKRKEVRGMVWRVQREKIPEPRESEPVVKSARELVTSAGSYGQEPAKMISRQAAEARRENFRRRGTAGRRPCSAANGRRPAVSTGSGPRARQGATPPH